MQIRRARLGKGGGGGGKNGSLSSPPAFFEFLFTELLFTTISEPGTGYEKTGYSSQFEVPPATILGNIE